MQEQLSKELITDGNMISLRLSSSAIVHLLQNDNQDKSLQLLFFLGLLPGGASPDMLNKVWSETELDWAKEIAIL